MTRTVSFATVLLGLALLGGCQPDRKAAQASAQQSLLDADRAFAAASLETGTADAFYANLEADALQLSANGAPVTGRVAIREHLRPLGIQVLSWTPRKAEVAASFDLGWTWGDWQLLASARSGQVLAHGKYVNIWKRDAAGAWKVAVDMGNTAAPSPQETAAASAGDSHDEAPSN